MQTERRYAELAQDGDALAGVAMRYGDVANIAGFKERFEPGAFVNTASNDIVLNLLHQRSRPLARTGGGGLVLTDSAAALEVRAVLPETRDAADALALVKAKVLRGLSVEFIVQSEKRGAAGERVVEQALLTAIGLVDVPAYDASTVAARWLAPAAAPLVCYL